MRHVHLIRCHSSWSKDQDNQQYPDYRATLTLSPATRNQLDPRSHGKPANLEDGNCIQTTFTHLQRNEHNELNADENDIDADAVGNGNGDGDDAVEVRRCPLTRTIMAMIGIMRLNVLESGVRCMQ